MRLCTILTGLQLFAIIRFGAGLYQGDSQGSDDIQHEIQAVLSPARGLLSSQIFPRQLTDDTCKRCGDFGFCCGGEECILLSSQMTCATIITITRTVTVSRVRTNYVTRTILPTSYSNTTVWVSTTDTRTSMTTCTTTVTPITATTNSAGPSAEPASHYEQSSRDVISKRQDLLTVTQTITLFKTSWFDVEQTMYITAMPAKVTATSTIWTTTVATAMVTETAKIKSPTQGPGHQEDGASTNKKFRVAAIVGGTIGCLFGLAAIALLFLFFRRNRKRQEPSGSTEHTEKKLIQDCDSVVDPQSPYWANGRVNNLDVSSINGFSSLGRTHRKLWDTPPLPPPTRPLPLPPTGHNRQHPLSLSMEHFATTRGPNPSSQIPLRRESVASYAPTTISPRRSSDSFQFPMSPVSPIDDESVEAIDFSSHAVERISVQSNATVGTSGTRNIIPRKLVPLRDSTDGGVQQDIT